MRSINAWQNTSEAFINKGQQRVSLKEQRGYVVRVLSVPCPSSFLGSGG